MVLRALLLLVLVGAAPALAEDAGASGSAPPADASASSTEMSSPAGLGDAELEMAVRAAYSAAAGFASAHGNYFARDGVVAPLHDAIAAAMHTTYPQVVVPADAFGDLDAAKACLGAPGTELRVSTNTYGDGIGLVAVTDSRVFAYGYDPHKAADIVVLPATACSRP